MLILKPHLNERSVAGAKIPAVTFIALVGFTTQELAHVLDSLVRVSRRVEGHHLVVGGYTHGHGRVYSHPRESVTMHSRFSPQRTAATTNSARNTTRVLVWCPPSRLRCNNRSFHWHAAISQNQTGTIRFPFSNGRLSLTLFPKSFSPFPHGTCMLSVSNLYSALDEMYHPLCAPIPRNVTLRMHSVHLGLQATKGALTLAGALFQEAYTCT